MNIRSMMKSKRPPAQNRHGLRSSLGGSQSRGRTAAAQRVSRNRTTENTASRSTLDEVKANDFIDSKTTTSNFQDEIWASVRKKVERSNMGVAGLRRALKSQAVKQSRSKDRVNQRGLRTSLRYCGVSSISTIRSLFDIMDTEKLGSIKYKDFLERLLGPDAVALQGVSLTLEQYNKLQDEELEGIIEGKDSRNSRPSTEFIMKQKIKAQEEQEKLDEIRRQKRLEKVAAERSAGNDLFGTIMTKLKGLEGSSNGLCDAFAHFRCKCSSTNKLLITKSEFSRGVANWELCNHRKTASLFDSMDPDKTGIINFSEFVASCVTSPQKCQSILSFMRRRVKEQETQIEEFNERRVLLEDTNLILEILLQKIESRGVKGRRGCYRAFKICGIDEDELISYSRFKLILKKIGVLATNNACRTLYESLDKDNRGGVEPSAFATAIVTGGMTDWVAVEENESKHGALQISSKWLKQQQFSAVERRKQRTNKAQTKSEQNVNVVKMLRSKVRQWKSGGPGELARAFKQFRYSAGSKTSDINVAEFRRLCQMWNIIDTENPENERLIQNGFDELDEDGSGNINFGEFVQGLMETENVLGEATVNSSTEEEAKTKIKAQNLKLSHIHTVKNVLHTLRCKASDKLGSHPSRGLMYMLRTLVPPSYDTGNTSLDFKGFKFVLNTFGVICSESLKRQVFEQIDADGSGLIEFQEFLWVVFGEDEGYSQTAGLQFSEEINPDPSLKRRTAWAALTEKEKRAIRRDLKQSAKSKALDEEDPVKYLLKLFSQVSKSTSDTRRRFRRACTDFGGIQHTKLDFNQFHKALRGCGISCDDLTERIFNQLEKNGCGFIEVEEFLKLVPDATLKGGGRFEPHSDWMLAQAHQKREKRAHYTHLRVLKANPQNLKGAMKLLKDRVANKCNDDNAGGLLRLCRKLGMPSSYTQNGWNKLMQVLGLKMPTILSEQLFASIDVDMSGEITFDEFCDVLYNPVGTKAWIQRVNDLERLNKGNWEEDGRKLEAKLAKEAKERQIQEEIRLRRSRLSAMEVLREILVKGQLITADNLCLLFRRMASASAVVSARQFCTVITRLGGECNNASLARSAFLQADTENAGYINYTYFVKQLFSNVKLIDTRAARAAPLAPEEVRILKFLEETVPLRKLLGSLSFAARSGQGDDTLTLGDLRRGLQDLYDRSNFSQHKVSFARRSSSASKTSRKLKKRQVPMNEIPAPHPSQLLISDKGTARLFRRLDNAQQGRFNYKTFVHKLYKDGTKAVLEQGLYHDTWAITHCRESPKAARTCKRQDFDIHLRSTNSAQRYKIAQKMGARNVNAAAQSRKKQKATDALADALANVDVCSDGATFGNSTQGKRVWNAEDENTEKSGLKRKAWAPPRPPTPAVVKDSSSSSATGGGLNGVRAIRAKVDVNSIPDLSDLRGLSQRVNHGGLKSQRSNRSRLPTSRSRRSTTSISSTRSIGSVKYVPRKQHVGIHALLRHKKARDVTKEQLRLKREAQDKGKFFLGRGTRNIGRAWTPAPSAR